MEADFAFFLPCYHSSSASVVPLFITSSLHPFFTSPASYLTPPPHSPPPSINPLLYHPNPFHIIIPSEKHPNHGLLKLRLYRRGHAVVRMDNPYLSLPHDFRPMHKCGCLYGCQRGGCGCLRDHTAWAGVSVWLPPSDFFYFFKFFSSPLSRSAITVSRCLPLSTGRQTLKSFLIMRETTEKKT